MSLIEREAIAWSCPGCLGHDQGRAAWSSAGVSAGVPRPLNRQARPGPGGLRGAAVRTATDLIRVWDCTRPEAHLVRARIAAVLARDEETGTAMAEAILASMAGSPNLEHVKAFRRHDWLAA